MTLYEGIINKTYKICTIQTQDSMLKDRLLSLGLTKDSHITIHRFAPNKATLAVQVNHTKIALRDTEAQHIIVESL